VTTKTTKHIKNCRNNNYNSTKKATTQQQYYKKITTKYNKNVEQQQ